MVPLALIDSLFVYSVPGRVLDVGAQNMLKATEGAFATFLEKYGKEQDHSAAVVDMAERSIIRPGYETLYLSEVLDHTPIDYISFDICPGRKTKIFDFNRKKLPWGYKKKFGLILNCGTSEHIFNQLNVFNVIHDATEVGGYMYHQVPTTGRIDHGYFCYHPRFFRELAEANGYEIVDTYYKRSYRRDLETGELKPRVSSMAETGIEVRGKRGDQPLDIPMHA
ncbi:MAG: hypothetical protein HON65_01625, partial [Rhodospirillales bacterium]|nr:hypothetical protein [Rhodospirillales bacterium]